MLGKAPRVLVWPEDEVVTHGACTMPDVCRLGGAGAEGGHVLSDSSQLVDCMDLINTHLFDVALSG